MRERTIEQMVAGLRLVRDGPAPSAAIAASGRATAGPDDPSGETVIALLDLPALDDRTASAPALWLAAAGTAPGWRRADVALSFDGGASWQAAGRTAAPAIIGNVVGTLAAGPHDLFDRINTVEVALLHEGMALTAATEAMLVAGANLAAIGDELVQFGTAEQIGPTRWRLGGLLRGRRGTDGAIAGHAADERFVLLDPATLLALDVPLSRIGTTLAASAIGPGDGGIAVSQARKVDGLAVRPPAPIALDATRIEGGTVRFAWIRRSRAGWTWADGADVPLGEEQERYRLTVFAGATPREIEIEAPGWDYPPEMQAADGWSGGAIAASLVQIGTLAPTLHPLTANWTL